MTPEDLMTALVVPLVLALLGIVGVTLSSWLTARSSLRGRLIDISERQADIQREFGIRTVAAVNELGLALWHVIDDVKRKGDDAARKANGPVSVSVVADPEMMIRQAKATEEWRSVLAAAHYDAAGGLGAAMEAFDAQRSKTVETFKAAADSEGLKAAHAECDALRTYYARQVYRYLQIDKIGRTSNIYRVAHVWFLGKAAKDVARRYDAEIEKAQEAIQAADEAFTGD